MFQFVQQQQCPQLFTGVASATEQGFVLGVLATSAAGTPAQSIAELLAESDLAAIVFLQLPLAPGADESQQFVDAVIELSQGQPSIVWGAGPKQVLDQTALVVQELQRVPQLSTGTAIDLTVARTLTVTVPTSLVLAGTNEGIELSGGSVLLGGPSAPVNTRVVSGITYPCTGDGRGCIEFTAYLPQNSLAAMNWGLAFGLPPADGGVPNLIFAPLAIPDTSVPGFTVDIDPLDGSPPGPTRSALVFTGRNLDASTTVLHTAYVSATGGQGIDLIPVTESAGQPGTINARLVFGYPALSVYSSKYLQLAPAGDFAISTGGEDPVPVLCGLQGNEYLLMRPASSAYPGDVFRFVAGQPAFAPQLPLPVASPLAAPPPGHGPLITHWTTSWVLPRAGGAAASIVAVSQPPGFELFGQDGTIYPSNSGLLGPTGPARCLVADPAQPMPLVPYGQVAPGSSTTVDAATVALFESQIIAPLRQAALDADTGTSVIYNTDPALPRPSGATFTTPTGDLISTSPTVEWTSILLGTLLESAQQFAFLNPDTTLQQAFQAGQLCLVMANGEHLGTLGGDGSGGAAFANRLTIGGWGVAADTGTGQTYDEYANVLIVKAMPGPLFDPNRPADQNLVANPAKWTSADVFAAPSTIAAGSTTPSPPDPAQLVNLSRWLQDYFASAASNPDTAYFGAFNALAANPDWRGVLLLRGTISEVPAGLAGITAGVVVPSSFNVHHLVLDLTPIKIGATGPAVATSTAVSGLIYYLDPGADPANPAQPIATDPTKPYDFRLLSLKVRFANSALQSFSSYAQVTLRSLFGSAVTGIARGGNGTDAVVLSGTFQLVDGQPAYAMSSATDTVLLLANSVLPRVEMTGLQMSTVAADDGTIASAIAMTGYLDFAIVPGGTDPVLDLFGFGNPAGQQLSRQGVSFSNLRLNMSFPSKDPASVTYGLDDSALQLDLGTSTVRPGSLVAQLSLHLSSLLQAGGTPADAGFLPVIGIAPAGDLGECWFGLVLDLNLGTPGMLAAKAGLKASLLLAWSPAAGRAVVQIGLRLPGTAAGAPLISLQNVLKLAIGQIQLSYDPDRKDYVLMLDSIALSFLGLLKIPPHGSTSFLLFGSPRASTAGLGWYAIYNNEPKPAQALGIGAGR